ncbi:ECF sigma factor [Bordetella ansorpii]|uniref:ECF sigma factor n=1 Tax=Bordetella ansorpii TaxID=288768 RepID=A0A157M8X3_9BORD|nr:sigma-70 family RNA polymerase sigma factor [Bordetella ansorpii]SAI05049.1 ECF sigma factor [Bordetella ansorpii]
MSEEVRLLLLDFLSKNYGDLRRRLMRFLRSPDLTDDALHDTWLRVKRLENQSTVLNPRGFLLRMAVNSALNDIRSQSPMVPQSELDSVLEMADPGPGPEHIAAARSDVAELVAAMQRMPQRRRDVVLLVRWEGLTQKEVAERLGVSLRTVELELKRANDFFAARLGAKK